MARYDCSFRQLGVQSATPTPTPCVASPATIEERRPGDLHPSPTPGRGVCLFSTPHVSGIPSDAR